MNSTQIKERARKAYEWGRFTDASKMLYFVIPLITLSLLTCSSVEETLILGIALSSLVIWLKWRGQEYGQSVAPGLVAGISAFITPLVLEALGICCEGRLQIALCLASGGLGGIVLGKLLAHYHRQSRKTLILAITVSGLTISLGCAPLGLGAIAGILIALAIGAASSVRLLRLS